MQIALWQPALASSDLHMYTAVFLFILLHLLSSTAALTNLFEAVLAFSELLTCYVVVSLSSPSGQ